MRRALVFVLLLLLALLVAALVYLWQTPVVARALYTSWGVPEVWLDLVAGWLGSPELQTPQGVLVPSGTIEADDVTIAAELSGRVVGIFVVEGEAVQGDQQLIQLDQTDTLADLAQAEAAVELARASLAQVQAGARASEVEAAEAAVAQAETELKAANAALRSAESIRDDPQELTAQIDAARGDVARLEGQVEQARAALKMAEIVRDSGNPFGSDREKTEVAAYEKQVEATQEQLAAAQAAHRGAQQTVDELLAMLQQPLALEAQAHVAQSQVEIAKAQLELAQAELALLQAGPRPETVTVGQAQVQQAESALQLIEVQRDKLLLSSPIEGVVTGRLIEAGEVALPGRPLLTIADLHRVLLTIYVSTGQIGHVQVGQTAEVTVDAYPDRVFTGQVSYISPQAEFTPRNVQTPEERANTVFAVRVTLPNPDFALKAGMPADARLAAN